MTVYNTTKHRELDIAREVSMDNFGHYKRISFPADTVHRSSEDLLSLLLISSPTRTTLRSPITPVTVDNCTVGRRHKAGIPIVSNPRTLVSSASAGSIHVHHRC